MEPGFDVNSLKVVHVFKPSNDCIAIVGIEFDAMAASSGPFRGDQRRPTSSESVKDDAPSLRTI
jgi:hypothetical protein